MTNTINDRLMDVLFLVTRAMKGKTEFSCDTSDLTILQFHALIFISKNKIVSMGDIADQFKISLPTATVLTDKLMKMGLIERKENIDDRRRVYISLIRKGERLMRKAIKARHQKMNKILEYLMPSDKKTLLRILTNLANNIKKTYEK
jgi:DNA-binding MarR family transcriptional regulator